MFAAFRPAAILLALLTLLTGLVYPALVTLVASAIFPVQASGSLIPGHGVARGSALIGQSFTTARYFHGRPSATANHPYDAMASGGSNLGPSNPAQSEAVRARIAGLVALGDPPTGVPVDLVTASGSGLDPHISPAAATFQAARVARARGLAPAAVQALLERHLEPPTFGVLGEARVNVLLLNLALDSLQASAGR